MLSLRPLGPADSLDVLTALIHRAYAHLGSMGLNYTAVDQTVSMTRTRVQRGQCWVLQRDDTGDILGTITVNRAFDPNTDPWARATAWYYRQDVAHLHQFAVEPSMQGQGWGARLIDTAETWAREQGHRAIALDTAVPAKHLRTLYGRRGYRDVDDVQWGGKRYRSVVMVKPLGPSVPSPHDVEHRCARVRTHWAHVQARDWVAMRAGLEAHATMHWPSTRERFLDADAIVKINALYPEGWTLHVDSVNALADDRVMSDVRVAHESQMFLAGSVFSLDAQGLITAIREQWSQVEPPPTWRTGAVLGAYSQDV